MRFLLTRRWILFLLTVVFLALVAWRLGEWQFDRRQDREQKNAWAERNLSAAPVPVGDVLEVGASPEQPQEWTRVTASGTYDAAATVTVRYQTRNGKSGIDLVTPLRPASGPAVLVDRGWVATQNTGTTPSDLPQPPSGVVQVTGWVRVNATGDATQVDGGSTRAVSSESIGAGLGYPVLGGFVDAESETPAPATPLVPVEKPDLGEGPHLFYGIQWWFFGALALFGFGYLAYDERKGVRTGSSRRTPRNRSMAGT